MSAAPGATGLARALPSRLAAAAAWAGAAFWLYYTVLRQVAGPLGPDEIYFSHVLWLVSEGRRQYIDFYSHHLPTYFDLLKPMVRALSASSADLDFLVGVRALSGLIVLVYAGLAWRVHRSAAAQTGRPGLVAAVALMLLFVAVARMVEVRTDTFGLLLVNAAWALVLVAASRRRMLLAAALAGFAILFSARAAVMGAVLGACLLVLAARARDGASLRGLVAVAAGFIAAAAGLYLLEPEWVATVIRFCFQDAKLPVHTPLLHRYLLPDRLPCALLIAAGLAGGIRMARAGQWERGFIVAAACGGQLLMIAIDPNPFAYVYGWAAIPAVLGVLSLSRGVAAWFPAAVAGALVALSAAYVVRHGQIPPAVSIYSLDFDATLDAAELRRLPTPELVGLLVSDRRQKNLLSQLRVRSEACRRLSRRVLTTWDTHPICLHDTLHDWGGLRWPALQEGEAPPWGAISLQAFESGLMRDPPAVFIWAHRWQPPRPLLPAARQMLGCCYDIHDGYAIARP